MLRDVVADLLEEGPVVDDDAAVVLVELLADDPHGHVGLAVEQGRRLVLGAAPAPRSCSHCSPAAAHVALDLLGGDALGRGAHDDAVALGAAPCRGSPRRRLRSSSGRRLEMP